MLSIFEDGSRVSTEDFQSRIQRKQLIDRQKKYMNLLLNIGKIRIVLALSMSTSSVFRLSLDFGYLPVNHSTYSARMESRFSTGARIYNLYKFPVRRGIRHKPPIASPRFKGSASSLEAKIDCESAPPAIFYSLYVTYSRMSVLSPMSKI